MGVLEDCPDELLLDITSRLYSSEQLAGFAFSCRRFYNLVSPLLQEFQLYQSVDFGWIRAGSRLPVGINAINPRLRHPVNFYVIRATLGFYSNAQRRVRHFGYAEGTHLSKEEEVKMMEKAVDDLGFRESGGRLVKQLVDRNIQSARVALLLLMHPNLEHLKINCGGDNSWINWTIQQALSLDRLTHSPRMPYFHALRELDFFEIRSQWIKSFESVAPFFLLPSIEKISVDNGVQLQELLWSDGEGVSTVSVLNFNSCYISEKVMEQLLCIPKALKQFSYIFDTDKVNVLCDMLNLVDIKHPLPHKEEILRIVEHTQGSLDKEHVHVEPIVPTGSGTSDFIISEELYRY